MHYWGDDSFDWDGLDESIDFIHNRFHRWRLPVTQSKEKFGSARIYCSLRWSCLLDITHPGWCRYPNHLYCLLDIYVFSKIIRVLNCIMHPLYKWLYRDTYYKACKKYPHLVEEICCMADYVELLDFYKSQQRED